MADVETLRQILALCEDYDIAMVECGQIKVVFNKSTEEPVDLPAGEETPEYDGPPGLAGLFKDGGAPKFNNE